MSADEIPETVRRDLEAIDAALAGTTGPDELTELGALALALREERPEPTRTFAYELDSRVAAGFPKRRRRGRLGALRRRLPGGFVFLPATGMVAVLVLVVVLAVNGGAGSDGDSGSSSGSGGSIASSESGGGGSSAGAADMAGTEEASPDAARDSGGSSGAGSGAARSSAPSLATPIPPSGGSPAADGRDKRYVERSAALVLAARPGDIDGVADRIVGVADRVGGFVVSSNVTSTDGGSSGGGGEFLLRVPTARLQEAIAQLSRIGHVRERRQTADDVTRERVSAADRLEEAEAERTSLLRRLADAETDAEAASLRSQLRDVNSRISTAKAALSRVDNRARYANVAVTLVGDRGVGAATPKSDDSSWTPGDAAGDALRVLEVVAGVLVVALAIVGPLALLVLLVLLAKRVSARRSRERALDAV